MSDQNARVNLSVNVGGNAARGLKDVGGQAGTASKAMQELAARERSYQSEIQKSIAKLKERHQVSTQMSRELARQGLRADGSRAVGGAFGASFGAGMSGLSAAMGPAMAVIAGVSRAVEGLKQASAVYHDPYLSESQKRQKATEALVPGAAAYRSGQSLATDEVQILAKMAREFNKELANMTHKMQETRLRSEYGFKIAGAEASQNALANNPYAPVRFIDKAAPGGQLAYAEEQSRHAAGMGLTRALREQEAARVERDFQRGAVAGNLPGIEKQIREAEKRYKAGEALYGAADRHDRDRLTFLGYGEAPATGMRQRGANEMLMASNELLELQKQKREEINRMAQAEANLSEKSSAARKAGITVLQTEIQLLQSREQAQAGTAQRFGMMHRGDRIQAVQLAEFAAKHGIDAMTPEMRGMYAAAFPNAARAKAERAGEGSAELRRLRELGKLDKDLEADVGRDPLADVRKDIHRKMAEVNLKVQIDEEKLAKELTARLKGVFGDLIRVVIAEAKEEKRRIVAGEVQRRAAE